MPLVIDRIVFVETNNEIYRQPNRMPPPLCMRLQNKKIPQPNYVIKAIKWLIETRNIFIEILEECIIVGTNEINNYGGV